MEPPVLFDYCHFRGCGAELEEQRMGLLDQPRYCWHRGYRVYLLRPGSRLCTRLARHSGPGIMGTSDDFLDNRSTNGTKGDVNVVSVNVAEGRFRLITAHQIDPPVLS